MPKRLNVLLIPCIIVIVSLYGSLYVAQLPPLWFELLLWMPLILAIILILLAWHFNKGKLLLVGLMLLIPKLYQADYLLPNQNGAYLGGILVNLSLLIVLQERGFFNRFAFNRLAFLTMQFAWFYAYENAWISLSFFDIALDDIAYYSVATLLLWSVMLGCMLFAGLHWWRTMQSFSASVFISLIMLLVIDRFSATSAHFDALLSGVYIVWIWHLLRDSHRMAYLDDLTQLHGRRALNEKLLALPKRYVIAMVDVDHFKKFNDTYGHNMGDLVLQSVAKVLSQVSNGGKVFRYGGEEFTLVFTNKHLHQVQTTLDDLREAIAATQIWVDQPKKTTQKAVNVTVSIGACEAQENCSAEQIIKYADEALYQAKRKGRNRVEFSH